MGTERATSVYETAPVWRLPQNRPVMFGANWRALRRRRKTSIADSRVLRRRARALDARMAARLSARPTGFRHCLTRSWLSGLRRDALWAKKYLIAWVQGYTQAIGESQRLKDVLQASTEAKYAEGFAGGFGSSPNGRSRREPGPEDPGESVRQAALRASLGLELVGEFEQLAEWIYLAFDADGRPDPRRTEWQCR